MTEEWFDSVVTNWSGVLGQAMRGDTTPLVKYLTSVQVIEALPVLDLVAVFPLDGEEYAWAVGDEFSDEFRARVAIDLAHVARHLEVRPSAWRHTIKTLRFAHAARSGSEVEFENIVSDASPAQGIPTELRYVALACGGENGTLLLAVGTADRVRWIGRAPAAPIYHPMVGDLVEAIINGMVGQDGSTGAPAV